ncbi:uncharacterized protein LTR77_008206 [Saxophila tyrrhenica]|uniref:Rhodopsin domain-containing protein n=1 Tax=Saxophila tyrrhenica TaxID=1690608 RepID=A0AAV9P252_9PEZI|nr:hypothetical protein LTR77_008206 [Saxophila tyrrhenica]
MSTLKTPLIAGGFGTPTDDDGRPWLWFVGIVCCTYSVIALAIRFMAKWDLMGIEDILIGGSYVFAVVYWGLFDRALWDGMGASRARDSLAEASELFRSSWVIMLVAIYLGKISVLLFARRIFGGAKKQTKVLFNCMIGFTAVCGVAAICVTSVACDFHSTFRPSSNTCAGLEARNTTITVLEAVTELLIIALPAVLVSKTTMNISDKATVIALFSFRLVCIPFMAAATTSFNEFLSSDSDRAPSRAIVAPAIWTQVVLAWSISSASFPCIKSFLAAFVAVADMHATMYGTTHSGSRSNRGTAMASKTGKSQQRSQLGNSSVLHTGQSRQDGDAASLESDGSQRIMITRRVDVDVAVENADSKSMARGKDNKQSGVFEGYTWQE